MHTTIESFKQNRLKFLMMLLLIAVLLIGYTLSALTAQDEKCYAYTFGKAKIEINNTFKIDDIRKAYNERGTAKGEITIKNTGTVPIVAKCNITSDSTDVFSYKTYSLYYNANLISTLNQSDEFRHGVTTKVIQPDETIPIVSSLQISNPENMPKRGLKFKVIVKAVDVIDDPYAYKTVLGADSNQKPILEKAVEDWKQDNSNK